MPWDHYFIENGAEHSAEIMRLVPYMIFGGQEGVLEALDCRVTALPTPGPGVQVQPGGVTFLNRAPGYSRQSYLGRLPSADTVSIEPTDSSGPRSDLVVIRSENPLSGTPWAPPADPKAGPYFYSRVIPDVDPNTTTYRDTGGGDSAYAFARIDIPASTATITQSMIKDLRRVVNPMTGIGGGAEKLWTESSRCMANSQLQGTNFRTWPTEANWQVPVPSWATGCDVFVQLNPAMHGAAWGDLQLVIDGVDGVATQFDDDIIAGGGGQRTLLYVSGTQAINPGSRGRTVNVRLEGRMHSTTAGPLVADPGCYIYAQLNFKQNPSYS